MRESITFTITTFTLTSPPPSPSLLRRYEPRTTGETRIHVTLDSDPIRGSPFVFHVQPGVPDLALSRLELPEPPLYATLDYTVRLIAIDKYGNKCSSEGLVVVGRIQGPNLPPGTPMSVEGKAREGGVYELQLNLKGPSEIKLLVSVSREGSQPLVEFAPVSPLARAPGLRSISVQSPPDLRQVSLSFARHPRPPHHLHLHPHP